MPILLRTPDIKLTSKLCVCQIIKMAQMPDAGYKTGTATNRTRRVPVTRMPGPKKLINAGIIENVGQ
jgi:hypothetical protein